MPGSSIRIDLSLKIPAHRQVADALRAALVAKVFPPGTRLPPVRKIAADLHLHHNTVAEAYRTLASEGWIDLSRGRGATVLDRPSPRHPGRSAATSWRQQLDAIVAQGIAVGLSVDSVAAALADAAGKLRARTSGDLPNG